jgi:DNA-binding XRE family transcriptional regulator
MTEPSTELHEIARELDALADRVRSLSGVEHEETDRALPPGQRLALARNRANLSQAELASMTGVSANAIVNFETGKTKPLTRTLMRLAEVLRIPWEVLRDDAE